jgi:hypothetical protein
MKLTGKCKEDFEKWFEPPLAEWITDPWAIANYGSMVARFYTLKDSMQYGVYEDFFDSVGIILDIQPFLDYNNNTYTKVLYYTTIVIFLNSIIECDYLKSDTKPQARAAAIEKANEIYNSKT